MVSCLSDEAEFLYKASNYYPNAEETIKWNDEDLNINWPGNHHHYH
jgi:dTDP-4-dehydrorhamnose 3,5-epimerase